MESKPTETARPSGPDRGAMRRGECGPDTDEPMSGVVHLDQGFRSPGWGPQPQVDVVSRVDSRVAGALREVFSLRVSDSVLVIIGRPGAQGIELLSPRRVVHDAAAVVVRRHQPAPAVEVAEVRVAHEVGRSTGPAQPPVLVSVWREFRERRLAVVADVRRPVRRGAGSAGADALALVEVEVSEVSMSTRVEEVVGFNCANVRWSLHPPVATRNGRGPARFPLT
jgi:hypothetical protein